MRQTSKVVCAILGLLFLILIIFENVSEQKLIEGQLRTLQEYFTEPCSRNVHEHHWVQQKSEISHTRNIGVQGETFPSYENVYRGFFENHSESIRESGTDKEKLADEYEPFEYTDEFRLKYRLDGLKNISVGEEGFFFLNTSGAVRPRSRIEFVRVLFYGISIFAPQIWIGDSNGIWKARFNVTDPGLYRVYVESVKRLSRTEHFFRAIEGSPFTLLVRPSKSKHTSDAQVLAAMPIQEALQGSHPIIGGINYPSTPCGDASWRSGRWLRCHHTPEPCLRSGWIWVPERCHFRIFAADELRALPRPLWIVFAGTSVQRGTFLSALDALTQRNGGNDNVTSDRVWR